MALKVGVVGCGSISDIYMTNMTNGKFEILELVACSDMMVPRMEEYAQKYNCKAMTLDEICADPEIGKAVAAISLSLQGGTMVAVDKDFRPVRPAMVWNDTRCPLPVLWIYGGEYGGLSSSRAS